METGYENWKLEMELETELKMQPPSYCSPRKIGMLLAFILRYPRLKFLISLASFRGLCHSQWQILGTAMVGNEASILRHLCKIICFLYCKQSKSESGRRSRNEAVRVGMLALFQDQVKLLSRLHLVSCPDPLPCETNCHITCHKNARQPHCISNHKTHYKLQ